MTFEIFHDIKKMIVNIRLRLKFYLDLIKVRKRIIDIERPISSNLLLVCQGWCCDVGRRLLVIGDLRMSKLTDWRDVGLATGYLALKKGMLLDSFVCLFFSWCETSIHTASWWAGGGDWLWTEGKPWIGNCELLLTLLKPGSDGKVG